MTHKGTPRRPARPWLAGLFAASVTLLAQSAWAARQQQDPFGILDLNGDGKISRAEARDLTELSRDFNAIDTNHDREISRSEFSAFEPRLKVQPTYPSGQHEPTPQGSLAQSQFFQLLDKNADGEITRKEARIYPELEQDFAEADTNHDGEVSRSEFATFQFHQSYYRYAPAPAGGTPNTPPGAGK